MNKHQLDVGLQTKPNPNTVILRNGTQNMTADLELNNNRIINVDEGVNNQDAVNKHQLLDVGLQTKPNTNTVI